jgi:protein-L-isoaspartate(D-aspartate) O-methyltransferase
MTIHAPVPDYAAARASMVDTQLRPEGVNYPPLVEAMARVKREDFVAQEARAVAYVDRTVPMGDGRYLSGPVVTGKLLTALTPLAGERALVVGCGTGYSAAVLKLLGLDVLGLESSTKLAARARELGIDVVEGPFEEGWKSAAPYHLVLIDGAVEFIPEAIISQLTDHGRLGTALIDRGICRLAVGRRAGNGFGLQTMADSGAAALPGFKTPRTFTF